MSTPQLFQYLDNRIRVVTLEEQPWFVAADVCKILGLSNPSVSLQALRLSEKTKKFLGLQRGAAMNLVSESGLYKLIMRSNKPEALKFQDWVTQVVLPAIRKDGAYIQGEEKVMRAAKFD